MGRLQNEDIKSSAELIADGGTASQLPNDDKIYVTANSLNKTLKQAILDEDIGAPPVFAQEIFTLSGTNITNGYVDTLVEAIANSVQVYYRRERLHESEDFTTSVVSLKTRINWSAGSFGSGGENELVEGDKIYVYYIEA